MCPVSRATPAYCAVCRRSVSRRGRSGGRASRCRGAPARRRSGAARGEPPALRVLGHDEHLVEEPLERRHRPHRRPPPTRAACRRRGRAGPRPPSCSARSASSRSTCRVVCRWVALRDNASDALGGLHELRETIARHAPSRCRAAPPRPCPAMPARGCTAAGESRRHALLVQLLPEAAGHELGASAIDSALTSRPW